MNLCKLCQERPADKTNTHFLTDGVIRNCLNEDGANVREKALTFDISLNNNSIEARFQRNTSQKGIVKAFGREASEEEISEAKRVLFSVDNTFCSQCEQKFTDIETPFLNQVLPTLRGRDHTGQSQLIFDSALVRKFFLLQVYRTAVCDPEYRISEEKAETLRRMINDPGTAINDLTTITMQVTYLDTIGSDYEYTKNVVGTASEGNNRIIFFNDFVIQTSGNTEEIEFTEFWGLNERSTFKDFHNNNEDAFKIKVIDNKQRLALFARYHQERAQKQLGYYQKEFILEYIKAYNFPPNSWYVKVFINAIINGKEVNDEPRYSRAHFEKMMKIYITKLKPSRRY